MTELLIPAAIIGLVVLASALQRVTGLGFAMVVSPFFVVMLGPHAGVMLTNVLGGAMPLMMLAAVWKDIEWRKIAWIVPPAVLVTPLFAWIAEQSHVGVLYVVVASLVILGLSAGIIASWVGKHPHDGASARILAGAGAGAGTVLAGVGGPAMTIYAVLSRWDPRRMAATLQPLWVAISAGALISKLIFSGNHTPDLHWAVWLGCLLATLLGIWAGGRLSRRVAASAIRRLVIALAFLGAVMALVTGLSQLT
ncbi:sulfite exporter TauE/SafE family protein [Nesterenkonia populi]|uniref:sulfite exporter TauE/SafE family protein n=1 Tax=Nesterenkonia populi TaxID=1591087 RepID=UPI001478B1B3|nr:sulfite exporter TauE/SafE family protein [Nesterenkonia populi]